MSDQRTLQLRVTTEAHEAACLSARSLKLQRDKLRQYQKRIEGILTAEQEAAKRALSQGNKQRALLALRRRKYQESLLQQTDSQLATLQELVQSIEFARIEKDVLYGLKQGTSVLKQLNSEMRIEDVEKLMGDTADAIAYQKEVDEMLQSQMSVEDEEAVQAELAAMEEEQASRPSCWLAAAIGRTDFMYWLAHQTRLRAPQLPDAPTKIPTLPEGLQDTGEIVSDAVRCPWLIAASTAIKKQLQRYRDAKSGSRKDGKRYWHDLA